MGAVLKGRPLHSRCTWRRNRKGRGCSALISVAAIEPSVAELEPDPVEGTAAPSTWRPETPTREASLSRFLRAKRTPWGLFSRLPKV